MVFFVQSRRTPGFARARGENQPDHPLPVPAPRLEQLEHAVVVHA
jgi:hypothetical protein